MTMDSKKFDIVHVLAQAIAQIEIDGEFLGNSNTGFRGDQPGYMSTKDKVIAYFKNAPVAEYDDAIWVEAHSIVSYFRSINLEQSQGNDFLINLYTLSLDEKVDQKYLGYIVAMVPTYRKALAVKEKESEYKNSDYVGVVGQRKNFFVKLIEKKYLNTHDSFIYTFIDRKKNLIKTWVTPDKDEMWNFSINDCIDLDGFVRKHEANKYNDLRETYINRIKVIENKGTA